MARRVIRQYLWLTVMFNSSWHFGLGLQNGYMEHSKGLSISQIHVVALAFCVTGLLAEIPTGVIADVLGRRWLVTIGCLVCAYSQFSFAQAQTFGDFFLSNIFCGIGAACGSGAFQAWMVDQARHHDYQGSHDLIYARETFLARIVGAIFAPLGAISTGFIPNLPWQLTGYILLFCATYACVVMREDYLVRPNRRAVHGQMGETFRIGIRYAATHPPVRFIIFSGFIMSLSIASPDQQYQPTFMEYFGDSNLVLSGIWVSILLLGGIGNYIAIRASQRYSRPQIMIYSQIVTGCTLGATLFILPHWHLTGLAVYLIHEAGRGVWRPIQQTYISEEVTDEKQRATINSCDSTISSLGNLLGLGWGGLLLLFIPKPVVWLTAGLIMTLGTILLSRLARRKSDV